MRLPVYGWVCGLRPPVAAGRRDRRADGVGGARAGGARLRLDRRGLAGRSASTRRPGALIFYAAFGSSRHLVTGPMAATAALSAAAVGDLAAPGSDEFLQLTITLGLVVGALARRGRAPAARLPRELHLRARAEGVHRRARADDHHRPGAEALRDPEGRGRLLPPDLGPPDEPRRDERDHAARRRAVARARPRAEGVRAGRSGIARRGARRDRGGAGLQPGGTTASRSSARSRAGSRRSGFRTWPRTATSTSRPRRWGSCSSASPRASARRRPTPRATTTRSTRIASCSASAPPTSPPGSRAGWS